MKQARVGPTIQIPVPRIGASCLTSQRDEEQKRGLILEAAYQRYETNAQWAHEILNLQSEEQQPATKSTKNEAINSIDSLRSRLATLRIENAAMRQKITHDEITCQKSRQR